MNKLTDKLLESVGRAIKPSNQLMSIADSILELVVPKNNAMAAECTPWVTISTTCSVWCYDRYGYLQKRGCPTPPYEFYRIVCGGYCT